MHRILRYVLGFVGVSFVYTLATSVASVNVQHLPKVCAGIKVQSLNFLDEKEIEILSDPAAELPAAQQPQIHTVHVPPSVGGTPEMIRVAAIGPILESYSTSHTVEFHLACTAEGVQLTATISRYSPISVYDKVVLWRPKIELTVTPLQPAVNLETIWRMQLTTGVALDHAQTPGYPDLKYPITVSKTLSSDTP